jgi:hypothetical protein
MTIGYLGKAHRIHATVKNCQAEYQSTVLATSSMIFDQHYSILIDPGAIQSFISSVSLKIIKVKAFEQDEFRHVEMASSAKKTFRGKFKDCNINLGEFMTSVNMHVTIFGSYDIVSGMEW